MPIRRHDTSAAPRWRAGVVGATAVIAFVTVGLTHPVASASTGVRLAPATTAEAPSPSPSPSRPTADERAAIDAAPVPTALTAIDVATTTRCRAAVLVHGGGYFMGDHNSMNADFADPLRAAGFLVFAVDYPLLAEYPQIKIDPQHPWYPRLDLVHVPAPMRYVHDRAVDAVAPAIVDALATGCSVSLVGVSAGGAIVADLANRFPQVTEGVLVSAAALSFDHVGGAPIAVFYGSDDDVITANASEATCEAWVARGSVCHADRFAGEGHGTAPIVRAALDHVLALA